MDALEPVDAQVALAAASAAASRVRRRARWMATEVYVENRLRGPVNAAFFQLIGGVLHRFLRARKQWVFADLPNTVVELSSGVGARPALPAPRQDADRGRAEPRDARAAAARVLAEVRRILRPGGRYAFTEHVLGSDSRALRTVQAMVRGPWAWCFEGCSCERDPAATIENAGFADVDIETYRIRSAFLPINSQIAGIATA